MKKKLILLSGITALFTLACFQTTFAQSWNITGNNSATPLSKLGTTNYIPLNFYTNNIERVRIDEIGRVGIGTSAPVNILTVKSTAGNPSGSWLTGLTSPVFIGFADNASSEFVLSTASNISPRRSVIQGRRARGTLAAPAAVVKDDYITSLLASGFDGSAFQNPAAIDFFVDDVPSAGNVPARISFVTGTNQGNRAERLKIGSTGNFNFNNSQLIIQQSNGNVSIGTGNLRFFNSGQSIQFPDPLSGLDKPMINMFTSNTTLNRMVIGYSPEYPEYGLQYRGNTNDFEFVKAGVSIFHIGIASKRVGVGITDPGYILDVAGRMRLRSDANSAGTWLMNSTNDADISFVGMQNNNSVGFYSGLGANWGLVMNLTNGNVGIGAPADNAKLQVVSDSADIPVIQASVSYTGNSDIRGIESVSKPANGWGYGIEATGGYYGGNLIADAGSFLGLAIGVKGTAIGAAGTRYGVSGTAIGAGINYGVFGYAFGGTTNFAGFFNGDVRVTGLYNPSDRKLKKDIASIKNSLQQIMRLKPSTYFYKTDDFSKLALPTGNQMGLIADEVKEVFPALVKEAVQPAEYDTDKIKVLIPEVKYDVINYVGLIPVLIASTQEQQKEIELLKGQIAAQQNKIDELTEMIKEMGTLKETTTNINSSSLQQNKPNPLDNSTNIRYSIPAGSRNAQLVVSDINGKKIKQVQLGSATSGNVRFDATGLATGTYTYSIVVDGKLIESKKMVVAK